MTRPDLDALEALLNEGATLPNMVRAFSALPSLIARVRELERERDAAAIMALEP